MGVFKVNMAEKPLLNYLAAGGDPLDERGVELVGDFARKIWSDETVNPVCRRYGVTETEIGLLITVVVMELMPEPWMNVRGAMLVPTQWFMEPNRLDNLLLETERDAGAGSRKEWVEVMLAKAVNLAHETKSAHDEKYGPVKVAIRGPTGSGCGKTAMVFGSVLLGVVVIYVL